MRFLLVSADQPSVKRSIDIPDRLVKNATTVVASKKKHTTKNQKRLKKKKARSRINGGGAINKPTQSSISVIRKNGSVHHRNERRVA